MATTSVLKVNSQNANKKSVVYNLYRDMLGNYNDKANKILENLPQNTLVCEDQGIVKQLESIIQSSQGNEWAPQLSPVSNFQQSCHPNDTHRNEPPRCIQNAMLTKDKKPFTYTPGGIDLSEIRSPRMARRLEMNAQSPGAANVTNSPETTRSVPRNHLPPSALAAMQPAIPIQVLPTAPIKSQQSAIETVNKSPPPPPPPPNMYKKPTSPLVMDQKPIRKISSPPQVHIPKPIEYYEKQMATPTYKDQLSSPASPTSTESTCSPTPQNGNFNDHIFEKSRLLNKTLSLSDNNAFIKCPHSVVKNQNSIPKKPTTPLMNHVTTAEGKKSPPILLNLNRTPTPWISKPTWASIDKKETIIPVRIEKSTAVPKNTVHGGRFISVEKPEANSNLRRNPQNNKEVRIPVHVETIANSNNNEHIVQVKVEDGMGNTLNNKKYQGQIDGNKTYATTNRIIPIKIEDRQQSSKIQNIAPKCKSNNGAPIQSRSFRILQKLTDSFNDDDDQQTYHQDNYNYDAPSVITTHSPKFQQKFAPLNTMDRPQRSNTHSPALDMYEERIRSQQQSGGGKAFQVLQQVDMCDSDEQVTFELPLNDGQTRNLTISAAKYNDNNGENLARITLSLRPKINDVALRFNLHSNKTNSMATNSDSSISLLDEGNPRNLFNNNNSNNRPFKQYERTKTHSRLLHLIT